MLVNLTNSSRGPRCLAQGQINLESVVTAPPNCEHGRTISMIIRIMLVFGPRPEAIKMAPLALQLMADPRFDCRICLTGQHRQMLDQVMRIFELDAKYDLSIMRPNQDLSDITASVLVGMRGVLDVFTPDIVLVHGDTATTFAATRPAS